MRTCNVFSKSLNKMSSIANFITDYTTILGRDIILDKFLDENSMFVSEGVVHREPEEIKQQNSR